MSEMEISDIRKESLKRRALLPPDEQTSKSKLICEKLYDISSQYNVILCFRALQGEAELMPLYQKLIEDGKKLYFPVTKGNLITFYACRDLTAFSKGAFSVWEPTDRSEVFDTYKAHNKKIMCITPGVAFDAEGNRIGFGKGYYDRFFASCSFYIYKVGVAFSCCLWETLPARPWDIKMDRIVTETN